MNIKEANKFLSGTVEAVVAIEVSLKGDAKALVPNIKIVTRGKKTYAERVIKVPLHGFEVLFSAGNNGKVTIDGITMRSPSLINSKARGEMGTALRTARFIKPLDKLLNKLNVTCVITNEVLQKLLEAKCATVLHAAETKRNKALQALKEATADIENANADTANITKVVLALEQLVPADACLRSITWHPMAYNKSKGYNNVM